jgi:hypothetical protein
MTDGFARTRIEIQDHLLRYKEELNADGNVALCRKIDTGMEMVAFWCELLYESGVLSKTSKKPATYEISPGILVNTDDEGLMILRRDMLED